MLKIKKHRFISILFIVLCLFTLSGCGNKTSYDEMKLVSATKVLYNEFLKCINEDSFTKYENHSFPNQELYLETILKASWNNNTNPLINKTTFDLQNKKAEKDSRDISELVYLKGDNTVVENRLSKEIKTYTKEYFQDVVKKYKKYLINEVGAYSYSGSSKLICNPLEEMEEIKSQDSSLTYDDLFDFYVDEDNNYFKIHQKYILTISTNNSKDPSGCRQFISFDSEWLKGIIRNQYVFYEDTHYYIKTKHIREKTCELVFI